MAYIQPNENPMPFETFRWWLVEKTGWTLDYIDTLEMSDVNEYLQVRDGRAKGESSGFVKR